jgi:hypothetical protein
LNDIAINNRKRSSRIAVKESVQEEEIRVSKEIHDTSSRSSRASRHQIVAPSLFEPNPRGYSPQTSMTIQETREERLIKREEEKNARILAAEEALIDEAKSKAREEAIAANGGNVPPGWETPEELEVIRLAAEKEQRMIDRDALRLRKDIEKKRIAEEKKVVKKAKKDAILSEQSTLLATEEEPWYLDCEICNKEGWNLVR